MVDKKLHITIDIFSGRENPTIEFSGKELDEIIKRLSVTRKFETKELGLPPVPTLGYRGLIVEQSGLPLKDLPRTFRVALGAAVGPEISYAIADETFEDFVCGSLPNEFPIDDFRREIDRFKILQEYWSKWHWVNRYILPPRLNSCKCAPVYEPAWWNVPTRQEKNNCYNYATNYRTDTYAQPGKASGAGYKAYSCTEVKAGAIADGLIDSPFLDNGCPSKGHLVALVIWPDEDYHFYRKDKGGLWSHKIGPSPVANLDYNDKHLIIDPRDADRGPYKEFCTFMVVKHGHIKIN